MIQASGIGEFRRVPKAGGATETLASGFARPWRVALDADSVYVVSAGTMTSPGSWLPDGTIVRLRNDRPVAETLVDRLSVPMTVMPDGDFVYFTESGLGSGNSSAGLRRVPKAGGAVEHVAESFGALALTADREAFYLFRLTGSDTGQLMRYPRSGGEGQALVSGVRFDVFQELRVLDGSVYYASSRSVGFAVEAVASGGGEPQLVWDARLVVPQFAADDCLLYGASQTAIGRARQ